MTGTLRRVFPYAAVGGVLAVIAAGLAIVGTPSAARVRRLDEMRVGDLQQIARAVDLYWRREARLPESIDALRTVPNARFRSATDPDTAQPYEYRTTGATTYELCARFDGEDADGVRDDRFWAHGTGRACYGLDARRRQAN